VKAGVGTIATEPRREGETAFPDLGTILTRVNAARVARRVKEKREEELEKEKADWADCVKYRIEQTGQTLEQILAQFPARRAWLKPNAMSIGEVGNAD
jgi:hypothetical protein